MPVVVGSGGAGEKNPSKNRDSRIGPGNKGLSVSDDFGPIRFARLGVGGPLEVSAIRPGVSG